MPLNRGPQMQASRACKCTGVGWGGGLLCFIFRGPGRSKGLRRSRLEREEPFSSGSRALQWGTSRQRAVVAGPGKRKGGEPIRVLRARETEGAGGRAGPRSPGGLWEPLPLGPAPSPGADLRGHVTGPGGRWGWRARRGDAAAWAGEAGA